MYNPIARPLWRTIAGALIFVCGTIAATAQIDSDSDPNSSAPVLMRDQAIQRVLAFPRKMLNRGELDDALPGRPFPKNSRVVVFVTNVALLPDESASAFRLLVR